MISKLNYKIPLVCIFLAVVLTLLLCSWYYMGKLDDTYSATTTGMINAVERADRAETELEYMRMIYSMAVEFNLSPLIVAQIYQEANKIDMQDWITWRFVNSPQYFTYLMCSIISVESRGVSTAVGDDGKAFGLTQMWMSTAKMYDKDVTQNKLLNPHSHIPLAVKHFVYLLEESNGNIGIAIIKWNRGEARVERMLNAGLNPENGYVGRVMSAARKYNATLIGVGG